MSFGRSHTGILCLPTSLIPSSLMTRCTVEHMVQLVEADCRRSLLEQCMFPRLAKLCRLRSRITRAR